MGRLQLQPATPGAGTDLIDEFARHMQRERGLSPITINGRCWHVRAFLTWLAEQHSGAEDATLHQVDAFLAMRGVQGWCRASIATAATALRSFYAHMTATGRCAEGFVAGIEGPRLFKLEALAVGPCKVRYRGLQKNATRAFTALALANIYLARQSLMAQVRP